MSSFESGGINDAFAGLTAGLQLDWDVVVPPNEPLRLPEWRPKNSSRIGLNPKVGQALARALFQELDVIKQDFAALPKPGIPTQEDMNHVYTSLLAQLMEKETLPARAGDSFAVEGSALVLTDDEQGGFEPALLSPGKTLFGEIYGPGYGIQPDAEAADICAYEKGEIDLLPPIVRTGLLLVLSDACLCSADEYGQVEWETKLALVPLTNKTIKLFGAVELE